MKTSYKTIGLSVLVGFLLSTNNLFAVEPTTFPTNKPKQVKSKQVKPIKTKKPTKSTKGSKPIHRKGQKEAGVLVEPTALD